MDNTYRMNSNRPFLHRHGLRLAGLVSFLALTSPVMGQKTETLYLSGTDAEHTATWEFLCTGGMNRDKWTTIEVPSQWELQGFGNYNYGHDRPHATEHGLYRHRFSVPSAWEGKTVYIVFEGSMTDTDVKINGRSAGPVHKGAFYRFRYDISSLLDYHGDNLLEADVAKESSDEDINRAERQADYWIFGGIFRPVYLQAVPREHIDRIALDARHDGTLRMDVFPEGLSGGGFSVRAVIRDAGGKKVGAALKGTPSEDGKYTIEGKVRGVKPWTSETPNLYTAEITLEKGGRILHVFKERFGFRTVEFRQGDGFYINGTRVIFKGVCRHTFRPEYGRASSKRFAIEDVNLIKEMNMNAVRMSHYPPDQFFLDVCDSLGLYVIDELAGWQKRYDTQNARRLIRDMVRRDVNHPCIFLWSNGNEGGFPADCRDEYGLHDPQGRRLVEPYSLLDGLDSRHYPQYDYTFKALTKGKNVYMPTEFLHGLHDGGHGAGLEDYWNLMLKSPVAAGGFLWDFADEGVLRHDLRDTIDVKGNYAPDGILGPHLEKEGSFYAIKEIWSPVAVTSQSPLNGKLELENRYHFTDLASCKFSVRLTRNDSPLEPASLSVWENAVPSPRIAPGGKGMVNLPLPLDWQSYDNLYFTATDPYGMEIYTWSWNLTPASETARRIVTGTPHGISVTESGDRLRLLQDGLEITFRKDDGQIETVCSNLRRISFSDGPHWSGFPSATRSVSHGATEEGYRVETVSEQGARLSWTLLENGWIRVDGEAVLDGEYSFAGISFRYPEEEVKGARLLSDGPYHVWKNRLKGVTAGLYDKPYNNTITGQSWDYPEFKGYYSGFRAARIDTGELPITLVAGMDGLYLRLFTPGRPVFYSPNVEAPFPDGDISVLNCISPVGTKFSRASHEGPAGRKNHFNGERARFTFFIGFAR